MHLSVDRLNQMIQPIIPTLIGVSLSYSGEPLLNHLTSIGYKFTSDGKLCLSPRKTCAGELVPIV
jgi:hypothetical protein